ncbi:MAG: FecR family protein [Bacteroidales bacterium]|nr:FecR family protein [Bacteroidales bacterium]
MENKMQIEKLIKKFYLGILTKEEMAFLLNYLKHEEPQHELLVHYQNMWDKSGDDNSDLNSQELFNKIVKEIGIVNEELKPVTGSPKGILVRSRFRVVMRYAAIFILAFGLSWLVHPLFWSKTTTPSIPVAEQIQVVDVPYGSKSRIVLPDGSVVMLNSGSSLKYSDSDFSSDRRSVHLTGEGFFNVTKNSSKPFYVITPGMKVKVLGTTFNVKAYLDEELEEATLVTGKVEIYSNNNHSEKEKPIILKPNQKAIFLKSINDFLAVDTVLVRPEVIPVKLKTVSLQSTSKTEQTISWKENTLVFDNEPFNSLIVKIERWYNVKILVNYPELNSARFTGKFDRETLEQVLNALVTVTPFNYNIKQNQITISRY